VTGTPLQNKWGDLYGLMLFLGLSPLNDRTYWGRCIERPLKSRQEAGLKALKVKGRKHIVCVCVCVVGVASSRRTNRQKLIQGKQEGWLK
jgi:hypothetical protein